MLEQLARQYEDKLVTFDPAREDHMRDYYSLRYLGRQGYNRYILEQPFPDVIAMMHHKIAQNVLHGMFPTLNYNYG